MRTGFFIHWQRLRRGHIQSLIPIPLPGHITVSRTIVALHTSELWKSINHKIPDINRVIRRFKLKKSGGESFRSFFITRIHEHSSNSLRRSVGTENIVLFSMQNDVSLKGNICPGQVKWICQTNPWLWMQTPVTMIFRQTDEKNTNTCDGGAHCVFFFM